MNKNKVKTIEVVCPYCNKINTMPENAGVNVICSWCGKPWYTSGIEVFDRDTSTFYNDIDKENKKEFESKKDED